MFRDTCIRPAIPGKDQLEMPLESLIELVHTLSGRIDEHGPALRQSEALTRYALIDPLLRELGWDTSNPDMVIPEYRSGSGSADYALLSNGQPAMMVEAKKLGEPLQDHLEQGIRYSVTQGILYFSLTDGRIWEIYETHRPVPIDQKQIVSFNLKSMPPSEVCLKAMSLWRYSVESSDVAVAQTPVVEPTQPQQGIPDTETHTIPTPAIQPQSVIPMPENGEWLPLSKFNPKGGDKPPSEMLFPDNTAVQTQLWKSIIVEAAKWLVNNNLLDTSHCPIQFSSSPLRYVVHTVPTHPNGKSFFSHAQVGSLYIETHANSAIAIRKAILIIESAGKDPAQFKVRLP